MKILVFCGGTAEQRNEAIVKRIVDKKFKKIFHVQVVPGGVVEIDPDNSDCLMFSEIANARSTSKIANSLMIAMANHEITCILSCPEVVKPFSSVEVINVTRDDFSLQVLIEMTPEARSIYTKFTKGERLTKEEKKNLDDHFDKMFTKLTGLPVSEKGISFSDFMEIVTKDEEEEENVYRQATEHIKKASKGEDCEAHHVIEAISLLSGRLHDLV
jgi:hypothetical protein